MPTLDQRVSSIGLFACSTAIRILGISQAIQAHTHIYDTDRA